MADVELIKAELDKTRRLGKLIKAWDPELRGSSKPNPRKLTQNGIIRDLDIPIPLRDGAILRGNLYRPAGSEGKKLPVIFNYSVYGKDGGIEICIFPSAAGLDASRVTSDYLFEAADPGWWCPRGYAVASVDCRGSFQSDGDKSFYSRDVGIDGYDIVEWIAAQEWSNGKVALYGASGYAMVQWLVAAERPPSLAAIIPIDGMTDVYREMAMKGGILETQFNELYPQFFNFGRNLVEDPTDGYKSHKYFDEYWQSKTPALEKIQCPAYIICSWGDHGIHTRGTINGWYKIDSKDKYLEIHQYQKWEWAVSEESLNRQKAFLDTFLLGESTEVQFWPRVRWTMRERYYAGEWRYSPSFPIPETEYTAFFPTQSQGLSQISSPKSSSVAYDARTGEVAFDLPLRDSFEFAGHAKLKLWIEVQGGDNADLFITLRKIDRAGNEVHFPWLTIVDTGPIGFGWLRVSRRELDEAKSKPWLPYHKHQRDLPALKAGEIVPVEIEIQPTSCRFRAGERLRVVVSSHDYGEYPEQIPVARHKDTVNKGTHVVHFGGKYDSHLLLPVIPPVKHSYAKDKQAIKMAMFARRVVGWSDEKFIEEYTGVHAGMTRAIAQQVPILRNYTQLVSCPNPVVPGLPKTDASNEKPLDCITILGWSSPPSLWASFKHPSYKATAGSHVFVEEAATFGILAVPFSEAMFDPIAWERRQKAALVVFMLAKSASYDPERVPTDLAARAETITKAGAGTGLLRAVVNQCDTPDNPKEFFADSPFEDVDWKTMGVLEQYYFPTLDALKDFFADSARVEALSKLPPSYDFSKSVILAGSENIVVNKDLNF